MVEVVGSSPTTATKIDKTMSEKKELKVLNLIIKQVYFDAILKGEKTEEYREIKPTTYKKLIVTDEEGNIALETNEVNTIAIEYDAIRFFVGYAKDRESALVEVKEAYTERFVDEDGEPISYDYNGIDWHAEQVVYVLGEVLETDLKQDRK